MRTSLIRKSIWGVTAVAIIAVLTVAALPMIASTQIVRDRIALEMSALSGYRVELATGPDIRIWPFFSAALNNVSLSDWDDPSHQPVLDAESVELELSPIAALGGNVVISNRLEGLRAFGGAHLARGQHLDGGRPLDPGDQIARHVLRELVLAHDQPYPRRPA